MSDPLLGQALAAVKLGQETAGNTQRPGLVGAGSLKDVGGAGAEAAAGSGQRVQRTSNASITSHQLSSARPEVG
jgi:hypothetical protein